MNITRKSDTSYDKNLILIKEYREGRKDAGGELAEINRPLVYSIANRFCGRGVDFDELCDAGYIGLVKAINTFDFSKGCAFSTYAVPLIFGEIRRFLRDDGIIKVSREQKRLSALLNGERERRLTSGEATDIASIASAVGVSPQDAASALFAAAPVRSLDEYAYEGDDTHTLSETVFDEDAGERSFNRLAIRMAIEKLDELHKQIIILRYYRDCSQADTAKILGLSQVKVSREEKKILGIIKKDLV